MKKSISILLTLVVFSITISMPTFAHDSIQTLQEKPVGNIKVNIDASSSSSSSSSQGFSFKTLLTVAAIVFLLSKLPLRSIYSNLQGFKDKISNFFSNSIEDCSSTYTWGCLNDSIRNYFNSSRPESTEGNSSSTSKYGMFHSFTKIISQIGDAFLLTFKTIGANKGSFDTTVDSVRLAAPVDLMHSYRI